MHPFTVPDCIIKEFQKTEAVIPENGDNLDFYSLRDILLVMSPH